jgi:hypothetical protein
MIPRVLSRLKNRWRRQTKARTRRDRGFLRFAAEVWKSAACCRSIPSCQPPPYPAWAGVSGLHRLHEGRYEFPGPGGRRLDYDQCSACSMHIGRVPFLPGNRSTEPELSLVQLDADIDDA